MRTKRKRSCLGLEGMQSFGQSVPPPRPRTLPSCGLACVRGIGGDLGIGVDCAPLQMKPVFVAESGASNAAAWPLIYRIVRTGRDSRDKAIYYYLPERLFQMELVLVSGCKDVPQEARGPILVGTRPQRGGVGDPPPLRTPKLSHGTMCFVGARGAGDFVLGIRQGKIFCSTLCVCTQNTQNFVENSKMAETHKKPF